MELGSFVAMNLAVVIICMPISVASVFAQDKDSLTPSQPILYRTPEERREAGLGRQPTDWLTFSGLLEVEKEHLEERFVQAPSLSFDEHSTTTVQLGFVIDAFDWLEAEAIFEAEKQYHYFAKVDEAFVGVDLNFFGLKLGQQYLSFGEYYSHFVTGPMLELGETRRPSVIADLSAREGIEVSLYAFRGEVDELGQSNQIDWGASVEWKSSRESLRFGMGYLSDLAETEDPILEDGVTKVNQRVPGWNASLLWGVSNSLEITLEAVGAVEPSTDLDHSENRPSAENFEAAWAINRTLQLATRVEHSRELEEVPVWKYGFSFTWRPLERMAIAADYLYIDYARSVPLEEDEDILLRGHQFGALVTFEF